MEGLPAGSANPNGTASGYSDVNGVEADPINFGDDFYAILQVKRDAGHDDIKKSFRKLALLYHPDKNIHCDQQIELQFKRIKRAYEVLSNEELRNVYDRHGEEGAQTYEMILHQQRMGMGGGSTKRKWFIVCTVWPLILLSDHYFNTACEWVIAWLGTAIFIGPLMQSILSEFTNVTNLLLSWLIGMSLLLSVDGLLYYFLPLSWAVPLASVMLHATLVGWLNTEKPNWDLGAVTFVVLASLDYWRGIPTRWPLGAYHVIAHCAVFIVVLAAYHIKTPLPAHRSYVKSLLVDPIVCPLFSFTWTVFWRILSIHFLGNIPFFLWIPVWYMDEYFVFPVEWVLLSLLSLFIFFKLSMVSLFFNIKRSTRLLWVCVLVLPLLFIHYCLPMVYLPYVVNAVIHFISFLGIVISDYKLSQKEKRKQRSIGPAGFGEYVLGTFCFILVFIYFDYFKRDLLFRFLKPEVLVDVRGPRFYFALFTFVCCIFFLFIFIVPTLLLGLNNIVDRERKKKHRRVPHHPPSTSAEAVSGAGDSVHQQQAAAAAAAGWASENGGRAAHAKHTAGGPTPHPQPAGKDRGPRTTSSQHSKTAAENGTAAASRPKEGHKLPTAADNGHPPSLSVAGVGGTVAGDTNKPASGGGGAVLTRKGSKEKDMANKPDPDKEREQERERERKRLQKEKEENERRERERLQKEKEERERRERLDRERREQELRREEAEREERRRVEEAEKRRKQQQQQEEEELERARAAAAAAMHANGVEAEDEDDEDDEDDEEDTIEINLDDLHHQVDLELEPTDEPPDDVAAAAAAAAAAAVSVLPSPDASSAAVAPPKVLACSFCGRKGRRESSEASTSTTSNGSSGKAKKGGGGNTNGGSKTVDDSVELKMCGGCKAAFYCGVQCQARHWPVHSRQCHHGS